MITVNNNPIETFNFSGGEVYTKTPLEFEYFPFNTEVYAELQNSDDIMSLLMITDTLRRNGEKDIDLIVPYLPYARQDKITEDGESLSLKVFCDLINSQNYNSIMVYDVHSDTAKTLLNNAIFVEQSDILVDVFDKFSINVDYLVSSDFGASKKIYKSASKLNLPVIQANKVRNNKGEIIKTEVYSEEDLTGKSVLIVDDICDGGRTFIELVNVLKLKGVTSIYLYVTHGIFSKGLECLFASGIEKIYTTDSFRNNLSNENLFIFNLG